MQLKSEREVLMRKNRLIQAFSPAAPINRKTLFAGRRKQLEQILEAVSTRGQHIAIYGERGVGKTSLVNIAVDTLRLLDDHGWRVVKVNCDEGDDFRSIWEKVFVRLAKISEGNIDFTRWFTSGREATPFEIINLLSKVPDNFVVVFDEFDRLADRDTSTILSDVIKGLSDESMPTTIVVVGVANDVSSLIEGHRSIERALRQIIMPRMNKEELEEIIDKGLDEAKMAIDPIVKSSIANMSKGLPHYTHLLAVHAGKESLKEMRLNITDGDFSRAIAASIEYCQESVSKEHSEATSSPRSESLYAQVLLACALAATDDRGYFAPSAVKRPLKEITGRDYQVQSFSQHLKDFAGSKKGFVLERIGESRRYRFRFDNPLVQPYTIFHGIANGLISESAVRTLEAEAKVGPTLGATTKRRPKKSTGNLVTM